MSVEKMNGIKPSNKVQNFIPPKPLETAVLFLVFNRLNTTKKVFEQIKLAKPPRLYIASDGARQNKENEAQIVKQIREYLLLNITWQCEVKTLFKEENLGCGHAVSGAITWFFENEEMGIILEDDCLPSQSFFWFCEELLKKYKNDMRIGQISGDNFQNGIIRGEGDYYFSIYNHIWGWASWANRWEKYSFDLKYFDDEFLSQVHKGQKALRYWQKIFMSMKKKSIDTWDYQWTFTMWKHNWLSILPNINLISNIGFGENATHTTLENSFANLPKYELVLTKTNINIKQNKEADAYTQNIMFTEASLYQKIMIKIKKIFMKKIKR